MSKLKVNFGAPSSRVDADDEVDGVAQLVEEAGRGADQERAAEQGVDALGVNGPLVEGPQFVRRKDHRVGDVAAADLAADREAERASLSGRSRAPGRRRRR